MVYMHSNALERETSHSQAALVLLRHRKQKHIYAKLEVTGKPLSNNIRKYMALTSSKLHPLWNKWTGDSMHFPCMKTNMQKST
jgi:hypothetical protein